MCQGLGASVIVLIQRVIRLPAPSRLNHVMPMGRLSDKAARVSPTLQRAVDDGGGAGFRSRKSGCEEKLPTGNPMASVLRISKLGSYPQGGVKGFATFRDRGGNLVRPQLISQEFRRTVISDYR
jgi:hypothetical protein